MHIDGYQRIKKNATALSWSTGQKKSAGVFWRSRFSWKDLLGLWT
jgi:hypothetical protein